MNIFSLINIEQFPHYFFIFVALIATILLFDSIQTPWR